MNISYVNYLNESVETLNLSVNAYKKAVSDSEAVRASYENRVAAQRHYAADREKTLGEIVKDTAKTATVRQMAAAELDDMKSSTYPPTASEEKAYHDAHIAAQEAISEIRKSKEECKIALAAVKKELEKDEKNIFSENANVQWLERMLQDDKGLTA